MSMINKIANTVSQFSGGLTGRNLTINDKNVTVGEKIADGGFGLIYECHDSRGQAYALKALQAPDQEHYDSIIQEFEIHKRCADHPNIVKVYGMTSNQGTRQATILMEFCTDDLIKHINAVFHQGFDDRTIVEIFTQICDAVNHMHTLNPPVIHRDLKPENVLRSNGIWKLCDFGSATTKIYTLKTAQERNEASDDLERNTTALYRAPEMCDLYRRQQIDTKADVWALGCILFKLCTFKDAFGDGSNLQILNCKYTWPSNKNVNQKFKDICKYIFNTNPANRPTTRDVLGELYRQFPEWVDKKWEQTGSQSTGQSSEPFNPFNNSTQNAPQQQFNPVNNGSQQNVHQEPFNPFGNNNQSSHSTFPQRQETFNPFGATQQQQQPTKQFNPFEQQQQPTKQFNPFEQQQQPAKQFNPFEQQQQSTRQFNPFLQQSTESAPVSNDGDTFDPFEGLKSNQQQMTSSQDFDIRPPSGDGTPPMFNPFQNASEPLQPQFNPFAESQPSHGGNQHQDLIEGQPTFNPFGGDTMKAPVHKPPSLNRQQGSFEGQSSFNPFGSKADDGVSLLGNDHSGNDDFLGIGPTSKQPGNPNFDDISTFGQPRAPAALLLGKSRTTVPETVNAGFTDITPLAKGSSSIDPKLAETNPALLIKQIIQMDHDVGIANAIYSIWGALNHEQAYAFFLRLLHESGPKVSKIISSIPTAPLDSSQVSAPLKNVTITPEAALLHVIESRKAFASKFPQFEGNFALTHFLREHRANPVPIGQAPICVDAVKDILEHIDLAINLLRVSPSEVAGEEAMMSYQATAFLLARLKQSKIKLGYTVDTAIPRFNNQHTQLKRAFANSKNQMKFPEEKFDFNDENFLRRIRPPTSKF